MPNWFNGMSWSGRFLAGWAILAMVTLATIVALDRVGFPFPVHPSDTREPFSREECIKRHQSYYFDRNPDMIELSDSQMSIVARACAVEEVDYFNGR